jgi:hypothetical protein
MKQLNRSTALAYAAGVGLAVLIFSATFGRKSRAHAQIAQAPASQEIVEPTEDPGSVTAAIETDPVARTPEEAVQQWAEPERITALTMIEKYGEPSGYTKGSLVWLNNGPWRKTVVYASSGSRFFGQRNKEFLAQTVAYRVPIDKIEDLKRFDRRLEVDASRGQLTARSDSERTNFMTLNLADEISREKRSVADARDFFARTERLSKAGKSSSYMEGILFPRRSDRDLRIDDYLDGEYDRGLTP